MALSRRLPGHHLDPDSKDVIKLATAVVGTLAALALALLIASAKTTYENANAELRTSMARLVLLDRVMARYGADTNAARARLRTLVETRLSQVWGAMLLQRMLVVKRLASDPCRPNCGPSLRIRTLSDCCSHERCR
jgi:hypothetical protein